MEGSLHYTEGQVIQGRYEILRTLASGSSGLVLEVQDRKLDSDRYALKVLYPHMVGRANIIDQFNQEVRMMEGLQHPNVVPISGYGRTANEHFFILMPYAEGGTLKQFLKERWDNKPPFYISVCILLDVARGLLQMHKRGFVHRDLNPNNILFDRRGVAMLSDFSISCLSENSEVQDRVPGTPAYMSPEQFQGIKLDARADIYAFGILAYELVKGRKPFQKRDWESFARAHCYEKFPGLESQGERIPLWFKRFVKKCVAKDPKKRFSSIEETIALLEKKVVKAGLPLEPVEKEDLINDKSLGSDKKTKLVEIGKGLNKLIIFLVFLGGIFFGLKYLPEIASKVEMLSR